jgi:hypothetical protein
MLKKTQQLWAGLLAARSSIHVARDIRRPILALDPHR